LKNDLNLTRNAGERYMTTFGFADELGPEKVIELYDPGTGLKGILVVDNVAAGPSIGGLRMAADVTKEECFRLARAMTFKNAMAGLAHGGGKSVIAADPNLPEAEKISLIRAFAHGVKDIQDYITGPDMGTNEAAMAHVKDVTGRAVGLPREIGGIPLDEIGATGLGLAAALEEAENFSDLRLSDARIVIQGFGSVGQHAAHFLAERGARIVGVSDSGGARSAPDGFDLSTLLAHKHSGASVAQASQGEPISAAELLCLPCEVLIPAARPDVIHQDNANLIQAGVIAQGANIPASPAAEAMLAERGVLVLPDFVANAGGVICAAVEYHNGSEAQAKTTIIEKIRANTRAVLRRAADENRLPRAVAIDIARERVLRAMTYRGTS
jgi:glutamate dehydrogenase/leucine dehydrogenase